MSALRRVGHKGADLIAPGNTRESFDAALEAGVDMIEFDVLPARWPAGDDTPLILAHDYEHPTEHAMTLDEGLAHLSAAGFADVELDVDLKLPGYERRVVEALRERGLVERALVNSQCGVTQPLEDVGGFTTCWRRTGPTICSWRWAPMKAT